MEIFDSARQIMTNLQTAVEAHCARSDVVVGDDFSVALNTSKSFPFIEESTPPTDADLYKQNYADHFAVNLLNFSFHSNINPADVKNLPKHAPRFSIIRSEVESAGDDQEREEIVGKIKFQLPRGDLSKLPFKAASERIDAWEKNIFSGWSESLTPGCYEKKCATPKESLAMLYLLQGIAGSYGLADEFDSARTPAHSSKRIIFNKDFLDRLAAMSGGEIVMSPER